MQRIRILVSAGLAFAMSAQASAAIVTRPVDVLEGEYSRLSPEYRWAEVDFAWNDGNPRYMHLRVTGSISDLQLGEAIPANFYFGFRGEPAFGTGLSLTRNTREMSGEMFYFDQAFDPDTGRFSVGVVFDALHPDNGWTIPHDLLYGRDSPGSNLLNGTVGMNFQDWTLPNDQGRFVTIDSVEAGVGAIPPFAQGSFQAVPEPPVVLLFLAGIGGLVGVRRHRRATAARQGDVVPARCSRV